jgi:3-oxoacid CoA-transferase subunit A
LIILGDAGINYRGDPEDREIKKGLSKLPITLFCIHGNHEMRPENVGTYEEAERFGGTVYAEQEFPNLLFAKDGEIYLLDGKRCFVIGGAYSIDKAFRLANNWNWWEDEQPSDEIRARAEKRLESENWDVDIVLSHTCPYKYMPRETFINGIEEKHINNETEMWLDHIESRLTYSSWYCGHFHTEKNIDNMRFMYNSVLDFE